MFTAITAKHVVGDFEPSEELYAVSAEDRKSYRIHSVHVPRKNVDLAIIKFNASREAFNLTPINSLYKYDDEPEWPGKTNWTGNSGAAKAWNLKHDGARGAGLSLQTNAVTTPIYRTTSFELQDRAFGNRDGYEFIYLASTVPGMSGGPIVGFMQTCFKNIPANIDGRPSWVPLDRWKTIPQVGRAMIAPGFGEPQTQSLNSSPKSMGFISLIAIHGRSEESIYGGRSGASLAVPVDMIADYLHQNATKHGIPKGFSAINKLAVDQYCS